MAAVTICGDFRAQEKESYEKPSQCIKKERHHFVNKGLYSQSYSFSSSHIQMWELDPKKGWALEYGCLWTVVLEKTPESSLDCKEIKPVNLKGNQPWIFTGKTDAKASASILGHLIQRADSLEKIAKLEKIEGRRRRGWQRIKWLDSITHSIEMNLSKLWEIVEDRRAWCAAVHGVTKK